MISHSKSERKREGRRDANSHHLHSAIVFFYPGLSIRSTFGIILVDLIEPALRVEHPEGREGKEKTEESCQTTRRTRFACEEQEKGLDPTESR